jgi:hypothetical protein
MTTMKGIRRLAARLAPITAQAFGGPANDVPPKAKRRKVKRKRAPRLVLPLAFLAALLLTLCACGGTFPDGSCDSDGGAEWVCTDQPGGGERCSCVKPEEQP